MSAGFSADWLSLREPFDHAARAACAGAIDWLALNRLRAGDAPFAVLDLACGTGANLRELAPRLGGAQRWLLVDHDPALLAAVPAALRPWADAQGLRFEQDADALRLHGRDGLQVDIERRRIDLATGLGTLPWRELHLVSASALLDLVSASWLQSLVARCRDAGAALLLALSVDGRIAWSPRDPQDDAVAALFGAHQRRDKGFGGPALGATAVDQAATLLTAAGYRVTQAASDWQLDASRSEDYRALLRAMIDGIAQAAIEQEPAQSPMVLAWQARRAEQPMATRLTVGHLDLLALP